MKVLKGAIRKVIEIQQKVLIVSGGTSSERKISLISAQGVKKGLEENGFKVYIFDLKKGYLALEKVVQDFDVIFPVIHGEEGEGGKLHKFLSELGKPYVGGNWDSFQKGWYKVPFKKFCEENSIPSAPWKIVKRVEDIRIFGFPCVLKASAGGSSKEVIILKLEKQLNSSAIQKLFKLEDQLFVEKFIPGVEVTVGILDNQALPVLEIVPPEGKWFDYKNKYSGTTKEIVNAPSLSEKERQQTQELALKIHQKLNLGSYSRIDFIINDGKPYALEVNTIPGWTPESLFPKAAKAVGISFPKLVKKLIDISFNKQSS